MPEVKLVIKSEADLKGIESATASLNKLTAAETKASVAAKSHRADLKSVTLEQYNLDSATVGTARAMGKAADETTKAATAKRGLIPLLGMVQKGAMAAGAGIGFLGRSVGALKIALLSTGWGIFLGAVGAAVGWIIKMATKSDEAKESVDKLTAKLNDAAEAQFKFAKGTNEATAALEDQDQAEIRRIGDVERGRLDASQAVEKAKLEARIDTGALTGEDAIRARTGLAARHRTQSEALDERLRQARETALGRTALRTQRDIDVARGELGAAVAGAEPLAFEQLPPHQQALMRAGLLTPEMLAGRQQAKIGAAEANLAAVQSGAAPVLERISQTRMDIGAERMVAGFRSGAAGQTEGTEMASKLDQERAKQDAILLRAEEKLTKTFERFEAKIDSIDSRSRTSRY